MSDIEKKITDHNHDKYITTPEFNTLAADVFNARLAAQTDVIRKPDFDFKLKGIGYTVAKNKAKHLRVENELKKLKTLGLSYFWGKNYFEGNDGTQNSLVFRVGIKYFKDNSGSDSSSVELRPAYVIINHKRSFFVQKKKIL